MLGRFKSLYPFYSAEKNDLTMNIAILLNTDISGLEKQVFDDAGHLIIHPFSFYKGIQRNDILHLMHKHGIYVLPTSELIDFLREKTVGSAIEIGAGNGAISRTLKIPITDSKMQDEPDAKLFYKLIQQPGIKYPSDCEKIDAIAAVKKYRPDTVIGAFITHKYVNETIGGNYLGVKEEKIIALCKRYINIGNQITHHSKPILKLGHTRHYFPWIITRSINQDENRIFIWDNPNNR